MPFAHDTEVALLSCVALVNDAEEQQGPLGSPDGLAEYVRRWEYTGQHTGTLAELEEVRAIAPRLRTLLTAPRDEAAELVNEILAEMQALPQLRRHDTWDWHLHAIDPSRALADRIAVETAMAMVDVVRADETSRIAVCDAAGCEDLLLDLSRNRSRRYCSATCGNREAVAAYRARQRS
ncbi:MAG: CGNR zinc finger domain-containing protein [Nocardioides sp.]|uniref:CGNR zinc finger domain-containing protein n=1 Tax=Nocardioides sp. TaxID=35761 RepID=UPI003F019552